MHSLFRGAVSALKGTRRRGQVSAAPPRLAPKGSRQDLAAYALVGNPIASIASAHKPITHCQRNLAIQAISSSSGLRFRKLVRWRKGPAVKDIPVPWQSRIQNRWDNPAFGENYTEKHNSRFPALDETFYMSAHSKIIV